MKIKQTIYQKAVTKFGVDKQLEKLSQELVELVLALSHLKEGRHHPINIISDHCVKYQHDDCVDCGK